jgi:nucleotide-binding universal stress UspA family protein
MLNPIIVGADPRHQDDAPVRLAAGLVRVMDAPLVAIASYPHEVTATRTSAMFEADMRADAAAKLESLAAGVQAELEVIGGSSAAHVLHDAAVARSASMIVVGSTHMGWLGRLAPGSTAERLLPGARARSRSPPRSCAATGRCGGSVSASSTSTTAARRCVTAPRSQPRRARRCAR